MRSWLIAIALLIPVNVAVADEADPNLEFFYPLVTGRPVIEARARAEGRPPQEPRRARDERDRRHRAAAAAALADRARGPLVFTDPHDGGGAIGPGDLKVENKFLVFESYDTPSLIAVGFEAALPTGSERRGLGGEAAIEAFVRGAVALGPFDVLAEIAYEWKT
jgi:hypothetical protein